MLVIFMCSLLLSGYVLAAHNNSPYDYSATIEVKENNSQYILTLDSPFQCLSEPLDPQYEGGLVKNPKFDSGLDNWTKYGAGNIESRKSNSGNNYLVAYNRTTTSDSFTQSFSIQKGVLYTFSAWLQLNKGDEIISAFLGLPNGQYQIVGSVTAKSGCWFMLKGGFQLDLNVDVKLFFLCKNKGVELWLDNVSLKPFTNLEWRDQQNKANDQARKRTVRIKVLGPDGANLQGATITIDQTRPNFPLGCSTTETIVNTTAYQAWFAARFPATSFNNEMKWYYTEARQGIENYTVPDAMVSFFKQNRVSIRGHNILWANANVTPSWVTPLPPRSILKAAVNRLGSVVSRYSGDVIAWDVMNENMHNSFYEEKLGKNASAVFYQITRALDSRATPFLNEYNTLEFPADMTVIPSKYVEKIREIQSFPGNEGMVIGIGLQGHFLSRPNVSYVRAALDVLGATKMPIWLTELDTKRGPNQAPQLEDIIREAFSHPAVEGIIVWAGWKPTACSKACLTDTNYDVLPKGCAQMCLTDNDFINLATGDVVDKLIKEWKTVNVTGITDSNGVFEHRAFLGEYSLTYSHPRVNPKPAKMAFNVASGEGPFELSVSCR